MKEFNVKYEETLLISNIVFLGWTAWWFVKSSHTIEYQNNFTDHSNECMYVYVGKAVDLCMYLIDF